MPGFFFACQEQDGIGSRTDRMPLKGGIRIRPKKLTVSGYRIIRIYPVSSGLSEDETSPEQVANQP